MTCIIHNLLCIPESIKHTRAHVLEQTEDEEGQLGEGGGEGEGRAVGRGHLRAVHLSAVYHSVQQSLQLGLAEEEFTHVISVASNGCHV